MTLALLENRRDIRQCHRAQLAWQNQGYVDLNIFGDRQTTHPAVGEGIVVEYNADQRDIVLSGGREFLNVEHKATIATDLHDLFVRMRHCDTECSRISETQGAHFSSGNVLPWFIGLKSLRGNNSNLCNFINKNTIIREYITNDVDISHLR